MQHADFLVQIMKKLTASVVSGGLANKIFAAIGFLVKATALVGAKAVYFYSLSKLGFTNLGIAANSLAA